MGSRQSYATPHSRVPSAMIGQYTLKTGYTLKPGGEGRGGGGEGRGGEGREGGRERGREGGRGGEGGEGGRGGMTVIHIIMMAAQYLYNNDVTYYVIT